MFDVEQVQHAHQHNAKEPQHIPLRFFSKYIDDIQCCRCCYRDPVIRFYSHRMESVVKLPDAHDPDEKTCSGQYVTAKIQDSQKRYHYKS